MLPYQTLPEHWHPKVGKYIGKEESIRIEWGELYLYTRGKRTPNPKAKIPHKERGFFECWHENTMVPGNSYTFPPKIPHWFQVGPKGSVILFRFVTTPSCHA